MALALKSLTVLSDTVVAVTFEDGDSGEVTFRFEAEERGGITVVNGEDAFTQRYRRIPGPAFAIWPERLVAGVLAARREPLPYGAGLERMTEQCRRELAERWEHMHQEG